MMEIDVDTLNERAVAGDAEAQFELGLYYYRTGLDMRLAVQWLELAATRVCNAQLLLGWLYEKGCGVDQDYKKAWKLYNKAAHVLNPCAMRVDNAFLQRLRSQGVSDAEIDSLMHD